MEAGQSRRASFGALSVASVAAGVLGWLPLVLSAGLAMGSAPDEQIAVPLALAGGAAVLGLVVGVLAPFKERHIAVEITGAIGVAASAVLGVVALVFAVVPLVTQCGRLGERAGRSPDARQSGR